MDFRRLKDKYGEFVTKNFVDITGMSGPMHENIQNLISFLQRPDLIKKSYIEDRSPLAISELRQSRGLRPADGLVNILTDSRGYYNPEQSEARNLTYLEMLLAANAAKRDNKRSERGR